MNGHNRKGFCYVTEIDIHLQSISLTYIQESPVDPVNFANFTVTKILHFAAQSTESPKFTNGKINRKFCSTLKFRTRQAGILCLSYYSTVSSGTENALLTLEWRKQLYCTFMFLPFGILHEWNEISSSGIDC